MLLIKFITKLKSSEFATTFSRFAKTIPDVFNHVIIVFWPFEHAM